jgi:hypothetical protein
MDRTVTTLNALIDTTLPVTETFDYIADFVTSAEWDPGVAWAERLDDRPVGLGSRYRLGVRMGRRVAPMEYVITGYERPGRVVLTGHGSGVSAVDDIRFAATETGSRVDYRADIRLTGLLRLVQPFLGRAFASIATNAADGMRRALAERAARDPEAGR